jgi:hypothetical protein
MRECRKRHPKVSSPLLSKHLCKTVHPWKKKYGKVIPRNKSDGRPLFEPKGFYFPSDSHETDERAKRVLADLQREQKSRVQNPSLLLDDLRELGCTSMECTSTRFSIQRRGPWGLSVITTGKKGGIKGWKDSVRSGSEAYEASSPNVLVLSV